jgi:3-methyladenine DNA glycosylase AlkD
VHSYARDLKALFLKHANPRQAGPMRAYMRGQFDYLGIKSPQFRELMRQHYAQHGLPPLADLERILLDLWALPQREFQYVATSLLARFDAQLPAGFIRTLEHLIVTKSWWDTVDSISTGTLGVLFRRYPKVRLRYLTKWRKSRDFWLRRACILFQLNYKTETDFALLCDIIRDNLGSKEFFINKAIGWALRQYTRVDPQAVRKFVAETPLRPLSAREALKWLERRKARRPGRRASGHQAHIAHPDPTRDRDQRPRGTELAG